MIDFRVVGAQGLVDKEPRMLIRETGLTGWRTRRRSDELL